LSGLIGAWLVEIPVELPMGFVLKALNHCSGCRLCPLDSVIGVSRQSEYWNHVHAA